MREPPAQIPLAIVGMACRLPGADSIDQYWDLIRSGRCAIDELPNDRFQRELYYNSEKGTRGKSYTSLGALASWPTCDYLPRHVVESSDPAHLSFCQVAVEAFLDSGMRPASDDAGNTGIYVGHTTGSPWNGSIAVATMIEQTAAWLNDIPAFGQLGHSAAEKIIQSIVKQTREKNAGREPGGGPFLSASQIAILTSTALGTMGPAMAVNAACASSLIALSVATRALQRNEIDSAVVGGTSFFKPDCLVLFSKAQSVSASGSRPFDQAADGLIVGEGCAAITVRRLEDAVRDGNRIHAVIHGVGIASDGKGKSLWAPRKEGQMAAIRRAYGPQMDLSRLGYVEAHATSTQVGDATELSALDSVLQASGNRRIAVGSVKANIGHTLETAGVAGLIKAVLAIKNKQIPPAVNVGQLNTKIDWDQSPLFVPRSLLPWQAPVDPQTGCEQPRRASVNSFGIGGLNAHVVLDEYQAAEPTQTRKSLHGSTLLKQEPIAITGLAAMFPGAESADEFQNMMSSGRDAKSKVTKDRWDPQMHWSPGHPAPWKTVTCRGGFIQDYQYDWRKQRVPPKQVAGADPLQFMLLDVVGQALEDASFGDSPDLHFKTGVVIGNAFGGDFGVQLQMGLRLPVFRELLLDGLANHGVASELANQIADDYESTLLSRMPALLDETGSYSTSTLASRIAKTFHFMGGAFAVDSGHESSFAAVASCIDLLRGRHCDAMICAAGQRAMDLVTFQQLSHFQLVSESGDGSIAEHLLPAEGAAAFVLKRLSDAQKNGDKILAVIDHCDVGSGKDLQQLVRQVCQAASSNKKTLVSRLETSLSVPRRNNKVVTKAIEDSLGSEVLARSKINAVAQQIGNASGASGIASILHAVTKSEAKIGEKATACISVQQSPAGRHHLASSVTVTVPAASTPADLSSSETLSTSASVATATSNAEPIVDQLLPSDVAVTLVGTPFEQGVRHGQCCASEIRGLLQRHADVFGSAKGPPASFQQYGREPMRWFDDVQLEEMRGIAIGASVAFESVVAHNLRIAGDISAGGCSHAVIAESENALVHGANEDLPIASSLPGCLYRRAFLRTSTSGHRHVTFGIVGQVCSINGMNDRGIAVSSAMLLNRSVPLEPNKLHCVLIQRLLEQATDIQSAVAIIRGFSAHAAASWGVMISDGGSGQMTYVEYDRIGGVRENSRRACGTNHALEFPPSLPPVSHSVTRLERLQELIGGNQRDTGSLDRLKQTLRDRFDVPRGRIPRHPTMNTIRRSDNQMSVVMQPSKGTVHFTAGPLSPDEDVYHELQVGPLSVESRKTEYAHPGDPSVNTANVCQRHVLRVRAKPVLGQQKGSMPLNGPALILGNNEIANSLAARLHADGHEATCLPADRPEELLGRLDSLWQRGPIPHLFLLTAFDPAHDLTLEQTQWNARRVGGVLTPYFLTQRWMELVQSNERLASASFIACGLLGGNFGLSGAAQRVESGAMSGLAKALNVEFGNRRQDEFLSKVIDFSTSHSSDQVVDWIAREVSARTPEVEVGYNDQNERVVIHTHLKPHVVKSEREPTDFQQATTQSETSTTTISPAGTWLISGGARGVSAEVAKQFALQFPVKLHLLGSSPQPDIDPAWTKHTDEQRQTHKKEVCAAAARRGERPLAAWTRVEKAIEIAANLNDFANRGIQAVYHQCDVSDRSSLAGVLELIRRTDGAINGVIHGAGFERSCRFSKKNPVEVELTLSAKVDGAAALMELTADDPLQAFVAFGSVSGRFGALGQTDYCLANDMLAKLVDHYCSMRPDVPATTFHWPAWGEVGMAVRPETRGLLERFEIKFMPTREGANHLIAEFVAGLPEREVLIADATCRPMLALAAEENGATHSKATAQLHSQSSILDLPPLISRVVERNDDRSIRLACELNPVLDPFLTQHRLRDRPLLPIVIAMEMMVEAASMTVPAGSQVTAIRNVKALSGLFFHTDRVHTPNVTATMGKEGIECELNCDFHNRAGRLMRKQVSHFRSHVDFGCTTLHGDLDRSSLPSQWACIEYPAEREEILYHGPVFRNSDQIHIGPSGGWTKITVPRYEPIAGNRKATGWILSPGILDSMMFSCGVFRWRQPDRAVAVPSRIGAIRLGRPPRPGEQCIQRFDYLGQDEKTVSFNSDLYGQDGRLIYRMEKYQAVVLLDGSFAT